MAIAAYGAWIFAPAAADAEPLKLERSAAVSMVQAPPEVYKSVGVDFVTWGGHPRPPQLTMEAFRAKVHAARALGTEVGGNIGTRTAWRGFTEFATDAEREAAICRRCDGTPVLVPAQDRERYNGFPAYWFSFASPAFRRYEKHFVDMILDGGSKTLLIDDAIGALPAHNFSGGCYSEEDVKALRQLYVSRIPGASEANFDLCTFQKQSMVPDSPIRKLVVDYYVDSAIQNVREMRAVGAARGVALPMSGNIALYSPYAGKFMSELDFFCYEQGYGKEPQKTDVAMNIFALKLGDELGKPTILLPHGVNNRYIVEHNAMTLLRSWIAQSYAFGGYFVVPSSLWMDKAINGSDWTTIAPPEYVPMFRFIKDNKTLFDGHDQVAKVAILHDTRILDTESKYETATLGIQTYRYAMDFLRRGIPFAIIPITSDADLDREVAAAKGRYDYLVAPVQLRESLARREPAAKAVFDSAAVPADYAIAAQKAAGRFYISLRRTAGGDGRYALHVLNVDYDPKADAIRPTGTVELRIPKSYLDKPVTSARVYAFDAKGSAPSGAPATVAVRDDGKDFVLPLDGVGVWSVIEF